MNIVFLYKYFLHIKHVEKFIWVMNHFLTMECYRKLCNKLYWKKLKPGSVSYTTRVWMITASVITSLWLAFYFDPIDPANSKSYDRFIISVKKIANNFISLISSLYHFVDKFIIYIKHVISDNILNAENVFLWRTEKAYIRSTSFLI